MQIYVFDLMPWPHLKERSVYPDPNSLYDPILGQNIYREHFDMFQAIEDLGFDGLCFNEHHSAPYGLMPSPNLVAAAITQRTRHIKIVIAGNLPALHAHPVRLAEEIAMLDVMSGGRIISGFVRGLPREYLALNVSMDEARERFDEAWDLIIKAWTEREPFTWHGKYFRYERVSIWPRPLQQPHPPIIMPAESETSQKMAARRRVGSGTTYRTLEQSKKSLDSFRRLARAEGWDPTPEDCFCLRPIYVAETNAKAREEAAEHHDYLWQKLLSNTIGTNEIMSAGQSKAADYAARGYDRQLWEVDHDFANQEGMSIIGDPDFVTEKLLHQCDYMGVGTFMGLFQFGSMPIEMAMKNLKMFAEHVLPAVHQHTVRSV